MKSECTVFLYGVEECSSGARLSSCKCLLEPTWGALKSECTIFFVLELPACVASLLAGCDAVCGDVGVGLFLLLARVPAPDGGVLELLPIACRGGSKSILTSSRTRQDFR